jgi:hypothetical protein
VTLDSFPLPSSGRDSDSTLGSGLESISGMRKAALYARVSDDRQRKEGTIQSQVAELKRQIAAAGDALVNEYIDDGYTGAEWIAPDWSSCART